MKDIKITVHITYVWPTIYLSYIMLRLFRIEPKTAKMWKWPSKKGIRLIMYAVGK